MADTYKLQKSPRDTAPPAEPVVPRAETPKRKSTPRPPIGTGRNVPKRLVSLDAYRGLVMTLLAASGFGLGRLATIPKDHPIWERLDYSIVEPLTYHFTHPAWESISGNMTVSVWDMIQPSFMFMVGVAMPFSYGRRTALGSSKTGLTLHALLRSIILVLIGVFLYSIGKGYTTWIFTNVLAQIGLGYFFVYLLLGVGPKIQTAAIALILVGYWALFWFNPPPPDHDFSNVNADIEKGEIYEGKFAGWSKNGNVAHFFDVWLLNQLRSPVAAKTEQATEDGDDEPVQVFKELTQTSWFFSNPEPFVCNRGGYQTLNFIPSMATILLGVLCGQMLVGKTLSNRVLFRLIAGGALCIGLGILAHHTVCPIVKRIWTPSWVLFSGGYAMWCLAVCYLLFDFLPFRILALPLAVVGMNSIAMYLMGQLLRPFVQNEILVTHFGGILQSAFGPDAVNKAGLGTILLPTGTFLIFWLVALWMYRNRYFVRI